MRLPFLFHVDHEAPPVVDEKALALTTRSVSEGDFSPTMEERRCKPPQCMELSVVIRRSKPKARERFSGGFHESAVQPSLPCNLLRRAHARVCGHCSVRHRDDAKSPLRDNHRPPHQYHRAGWDGATHSLQPRRFSWRLGL